MEYKVNISITNWRTADSALEAATRALNETTNGTRGVKTTAEYRDDTKVVITVAGGRFANPHEEHVSVQRKMN